MLMTMKTMVTIKLMGMGIGFGVRVRVRLRVRVMMILVGIVKITEQVQENERKEYNLIELMMIIMTNKNDDDYSRQVINGTCGWIVYIYICICDGSSRKVATLLLFNRIMEIYNNAFFVSLSHRTRKF